MLSLRYSIFSFLSVFWVLMSVYIFFWLLIRIGDSLLYSTAAYTYISFIVQNPFALSIYMFVSFSNWYVLEGRNHVFESLVPRVLPGTKRSQEMFDEWQNGWMASNLSAYTISKFTVYLFILISQRGSCRVRQDRSWAKHIWERRMKKRRPESLKIPVWMREIELGSEPKNQSLSQQERLES